MNEVNEVKENLASFTLKENTLSLEGSWTLPYLNQISRQLKNLDLPPSQLTIDFKNLNHLDTAGAWYLQMLFKQLNKKNINYQLENTEDKQKRLLRLIEQQCDKISAIQAPEKMGTLARIGISAIDSYYEALAWLHFIGEVFMTTLFLLRYPWRIRWNYFFNVIENNGFHALPIIGFLSFLVGVVLTYQIGLELRTYGANIFIINLLGLAIFREFGPLMTAIIVTGRTGSAFTAQLGLMKSNEEIDALQTMGHSPSEFLIMPRMFGLMIIMPLLIVWADVFGILGGMFMSKVVLGISYFDFLNRFPGAVTLTTFTIGMIKAPVFAMIIASVGCFHGFRVTGSSESIGAQTTRSVVMAIFMLIIADAAFSVILSWLDI